ncbi:MAG TPA: hypothetical protein DCE42_07990, partial [Myxococcales bacterium]|nr:hypothetical protein [Myxococcales bacterium]
QLLDALAYAHSQGVVHRDLKPENLILIPGARGRRTLKILDFGIARMVEDERDRRLTETGLAVGTPRYMSPEQAAGEIDLIDHRADLYACGVLLVEMLTGRQLFMGSRNEILLHHMDTPAPTLSELAPGHGYPPAVEQLVAKALAKHPHERFQSAEAFADQLFTVFGMEPSAWGPTPSRQTRAPQPAAPQTGMGISTNALPGNVSLASTGQHTPQSRVGPDPSAITRALPGKQGTLPPPLNHPQGFSMGPGSTSGVGYSGEKQSDSIAQMPSPQQPTPKKSSSQGMLWVIIGLSGGLALGVIFFIIGSLTGPSEQPQTRNVTPRQEITPPSPTRFPEPPRNTTNPLPKVEVEQATLRLIPDPSDAIVLINGKRVSGDIPLLVKVKKDTRVHVLVKHPKYVTKDFFWVGAKDEMRDVKLTALTRPEPIVRPRPRWRKRWRPRRVVRRRVVRRRVVRRRVVRRRPPTPRDTNVYFTLRIYSNPGKATILVNDVPKGRSPLTIRALKGQRTKIFVKKQGYLSQRFYWTPMSNTSRRVKLPEDIFGGN